MDKKTHKHEWNEDLECACGAILTPPGVISNQEPALPAKPAIQIIVELRKKIVGALDEAMQEILEKEKP